MTILTEQTLRLGRDPSQRAEFITLGEQLAKLNHPACPDVDWKQVEQLTIALFREHGLELQSAAAFALAHAQIHGLAGMGDGILLVNRLLAQDWEHLWPPALPARLEILAWLFTQLQPLFRRQELTADQLPELSRLDDELRLLSDGLEAHVQVPLVPLQALRKQLNNALHRLQRNATPAIGDEVPMAAPADEPKPAPRKPVATKRRVAVGSRQGAAPAVVVLKLDAKEPTSDAEPNRRAIWSWLRVLLILLLLLLLSGLFWWWAKSGTILPIGQSSTVSLPALNPAPQTKPSTVPIHLDNLVLFPPGRAELKPESTKVLINSLIDIKAQPGWLIVITGHSDVSGHPEHNRVLSRERAEAVKHWMQSMGDIPENCFVVEGKGADQPIADNDTESGRMRNRRVDIQLVPSAGACPVSLR